MVANDETVVLPQLDWTPKHDGAETQPIAVVEQRVSNLAQGALCLVLLSGPFMHLLSLIPRGMFSECGYHRMRFNRFS